MGLASTFGVSPPTHHCRHYGREDTGDLAALVGAKYLITSYVALVNLSSAFNVPSSRVDASGVMAPGVARVPGLCSLRLEREHPPPQQEQPLPELIPQRFQSPDGRPPWSLTCLGAAPLPP